MQKIFFIVYDIFILPSLPDEVVIILNPIKVFTLEENSVILGMLLTLEFC